MLSHAHAVLLFVFLKALRLARYLEYVYRRGSILQMSILRVDLDTWRRFLRPTVSTSRWRRMVIVLLVSLAGFEVLNLYLARLIALPRVF